MAIAAHSFSHLHIGLFQEDETSNSDEETITNQSHSARVYEEFDLGLIFQNSWCLENAHCSTIGKNEEFSYSENGKTNRDSEDDNAMVETALEAESNSTEFDEATNGNLDIMTKGDVVENRSVLNSVEGDTEIKATEEDYTNDSGDITPVAKDNMSQDTKTEEKVNIEITVTTMETDTEVETVSEHEVNGDRTIAIKDTVDKIMAEYEIRRTHHELFSYGRQRQRVNKRERQVKKLEKRKVERRIEPSEIGFHFYCTQILILPDCVTDDDKEKVLVDEVADATSETTTTLNEDVSASNVDEKTEVSISDVGNKEDSECRNASEVSESNYESDKTQLHDDESFFAELGIDIHDDCTFEWDDCLDWDGITVTPVKSKSKPASPKSQPKNIKDSQKKKTNNVPVTIDTTSFEFSFPNYRMSTYEQTRLIDLECKSTSFVYLRKDRHRKREKLHKAIKSHHCTELEIINNHGRKAFYIDHRVLDKSNLDIEYRCFSRSHLSPMPKKGVDLSVARAIKLKAPASRNNNRAAPAQNLRHVLHETNRPQAIENDLVSFLITLQNRDLTPEDYEMLLRLDDTVKAKTVSKNVLVNLKSEPVGEDIANILNCVICMEPYLIGQTRKFLPCDHDFHSDCIDSWLSNNSQNCPLDGLPIADS